MFSRRKLLSLIPFVSVALAQTAILEKGKAVVCESDPVRCPLDHPTCKKIDAPIVVGSGNYSNPDVAPLNDYHVLLCETCGILFVKK